MIDIIVNSVVVFCAVAQWVLLYHAQRNRKKANELLIEARRINLETDKMMLQKFRWTVFQDGLPPTDTTVIVLLEDGYVTFATHIKYGEFLFPKHFIFNDEIKPYAWQPMPVGLPIMK